MTDHVRLEHVKRIRIHAGGRSIVDTTRGYVVHEGSLPPRYYVPRDEVHGELTDGHGAASCPWKGQWKHLDLTTGGTRIGNAAWTYYDTTPDCHPIKDFVAFYPDKLAIEVD